jgi:hypothetical protein
LGRPFFKYQIKGTASGARLYFESLGFAGNAVELFNIQGHRVAHENLSGSSSNSVFLGTIPNGIYFLKIEDASKSVLERVLINK